MVSCLALALAGVEIIGPAGLPARALAPHQVALTLGAFAAASFRFGLVVLACSRLAVVIGKGALAAVFPARAAPEVEGASVFFALVVDERLAADLAHEFAQLHPGPVVLPFSQS